MKLAGYLLSRLIAPLARVKWGTAHLCAVLAGLMSISGSTSATLAPLFVGAVFSSAQPSAQSFLRFFNTGTSAGTVTVTLRDASTGALIAPWTSPVIPANAELQFTIAAIESAINLTANQPATYSVSIQSGINGYFQHVLWRPADGTLTNLSTCTNGATSDTTANRAKVSAVHSSLLQQNFPSTVVVNNTGATAAAATLGVYDARDGTKRGSFTTTLIPTGGQALVSIPAIEAVVGAAPAGLFHYVIKSDGAFTGFLQHLVNNVQAGVTTDMTAACPLSGIASPGTASPLAAGTIFSTTQSASQSFLRFQNTGATAGTVTVTLRDYATGQSLGLWTSGVIPANSEQQFSIATLEAALGLGSEKPAYYTASIQSGITGYFQHVLWRPADGTLTNLSTCAAGVTTDTTKLGGVHSSLLQGNFPSTVVVNNTGGVAAAATLGVYDARTGFKLGTFTTAVIPAGGQADVSMPSIEASVGPASAGLYHYVIKAEGSFTGFLQHLVNNVQVGVTTDMTTACALSAPVAVPTFTSVAGGRFGAGCKSGQVSLDGYLIICSGAGKFRYAVAEDLPPAPSAGYLARPAWYPRLSDMHMEATQPSCPASGRVTFTSMVLPLDQLADSVPQGAMVGDHVTPIDHGYIGMKALNKALATRTEADYVPIYAPADGEVFGIFQLSPTLFGFSIAHGCDTYTTMINVNRLSGALASALSELQAKGSVTTKFHVTAGQKIGESRDNPLDFAVTDGAHWLSGYASPFAYAEGEAWKPYTSDPLTYFTPDLAAALNASLERTAPPAWGKIDQDVAGTAVGNWFLDGTVGYSGRSKILFQTASATISGGPVAGKNDASWSHLSLVRHWTQPDLWVFSTGWFLNPDGDPRQFVLDVGSDQPNPSELTPDVGIVVYRLRNLNPPTSSSGISGPVAAIVAVQVNDDQSLTIEPVTSQTDPAKFLGFTAAARTYRR